MRRDGGAGRGGSKKFLSTPGNPVEPEKRGGKKITKGEVVSARGMARETCGEAGKKGVWESKEMWK